MLKLKLARDLRKSILRGHPWIYSQALENTSYVGPSCLAELSDKKGFLAWVMYCPKSPLAARVMSLEKKPPNRRYFEKQMERAWKLRELLETSETQAYRLFNGEGDGLPGLVCDVYSSVAVLQFDGESCYEFWNEEDVAAWLLEHRKVDTVYYKPRFSDKMTPKTWGRPLDSPWVESVENAVRFKVNVVEGQKTGFFLDQRDNRSYLGQWSQGKSVLNLFSYTGGFSVYAGLGGAQSVTSVDLAPEAIRTANENWTLNGLPEKQHDGVVADVFDFIEKNEKKYDLVMVDPPSMTHSEKTKAAAIKSYTDLFQKAARLVKPGGHLFLSSCSSHISFPDFLAIMDEALSGARRNGQVLRISGQGSDHPLPHSCRELRYLKFVHVAL